jgi:hypothetical protein
VVYNPNLLFWCFFIKYSFQQKKDTKKHIHRIEPRAIRLDARAYFEMLRALLGKYEDTEADDSQISVEIRSIVGFIDDGLVIRDVENG